MFQIERHVAEPIYHHLTADRRAAPGGTPDITELLLT
jgi:hypothetical protein